MIYVHSLGRASRYYAQRTALVVDGASVSFKALHERVRNIAAALAANGFAAGARAQLLVLHFPRRIELGRTRRWVRVTTRPTERRLQQELKHQGLVRA